MTPADRIAAVLARVKDIEERATRLDDFRMPLPMWATESRTLLPALAEALEVALAVIDDLDSSWDCDTGANGAHPHYCRTCGARETRAQVAEILERER